MNADDRAAESGRPSPRPAIPAPILESRLIAIGRGLDPARTTAIAEALADAGIRAFEVTLNSRDALAAIRALRARFADDEMLVGAGTILSVVEAEDAVQAGARFLVSPHTDVVIVSWAAERGIPCFPGAFTPTEIHLAWRAGASAVKLFPSSAVGPAFVRDFRGPFPEIPLVPTGGVTAESGQEFLAAGAVAVGLGGWLMGDGDPAAIGARAREAVAAIRGEPVGGRR
jgi:2-dehydro-3-deoxyphosphogluconate aldolase/(4S)-4-hydroxy-2-oxoglutarate aldolase